LIHGEQHEIVEHDLDHRAETRKRCPDGKGDKTRFGQRGVYDPLLTEFA
jgi:hypothetical protein